ncbi:MAG: DUF1572 domain-containing protein [Flavobacteriaceae bacterium]
MKLSITLAHRFREVILNGKWVANTNLKAQLETVTFDKAEIKIGSLNTMAILAQHIHYYVVGVKQVLEGGTLNIKDVYSFSFSPIESKDQWETFLNNLWNDAEAFATLVEQVPDSQLSSPFVDIKYGTYLRNIEGMIEHCYYHLGQIVLLNKMLSKG